MKLIPVFLILLATTLATFSQSTMVNQNQFNTTTGTSTQAQIDAKLDADASPLESIAPKVAAGTQLPLSPYFTNQLRRHFTQAEFQTLTLYTVGDSMMSGSSRVNGYIEKQLKGSTPVIGYALDSLITSVTSGTVVEPPGNSNANASPDIFDSGKVWKMSSGAVVNIRQNANGSLASKVQVWCSKQVGGGTATVEYSANGGSSWSSVGTIDTSTATGVAKDVAAGSWTIGGPSFVQLRVTATGGPVHLVGARIWDGTRTGVIIANSNMGGTSVASWNQGSDSIRNKIGEDFGPTVVISNWREGAGELTEAILDEWLDNWRTALPTSEFILMDQIDIPSLGDTAVTEAVNGLYKAAATERNYVREYNTNAVLGTEPYREMRGWHKSAAIGTSFSVNTSTNVITIAGGTHSLTVGARVIVVTTTGTPPAPLVAWTPANVKNYWVTSVPTSTTLTVSDTEGGANVDITDSGSGTHVLWSTDQVHLNADGWLHVGTNIANRLVDGAEDVVFGQIFQSPSGSQEVVFGNNVEDYASRDYAFRVARTGKQRFGLLSRSSTGAETRFAWRWTNPSDTFSDGALLEFANDSGFKTPMVIDNSGYTYLGPYNATTQSGYTRGARVVIDEDYDQKACLQLRHKSATATKVIDVQNSSSASIFMVNRTDVTFGAPCASLIFEGATDNANELTLNVEDPAADATVTIDSSYSGTLTPTVTGTGSLDYGSISAGAEATLTVTVTGAVTTNTPTVELGWSAALEDGIIVKQAWVSGSNTVSVRVANVSGSPIDPASVTCRATVTNY